MMDAHGLFCLSIAFAMHVQCSAVLFFFVVKTITRMREKKKKLYPYLGRIKLNLQPTLVLKNTSPKPALAAWLNLPFSH